MSLASAPARSARSIRYLPSLGFIALAVRRL